MHLTDWNLVLKIFRSAKYFSFIHLKYISNLSYLGTEDLLVSKTNQPCSLGAYMRVLETNDKQVNICIIYTQEVVRKTKQGPLSGVVC